MRPELKKAVQETALKFEQAKIKKEEADEIMNQVIREEKIVM